MSKLEGRVAIVTGAGRGLGREHALLLAGEGGKVVVNDLGGAADGSGANSSPARSVVAEIEAAGGEAVANTENVADWQGAQRLIASALDAFGDLHVLVNNAGILRDRTLVNLSEAEWDDVIRVHLKGHAAPTHWALDYWRQRTSAGETVEASVINTSSISGLVGNFGQANYGAAKAGIAAATIIGAMEAARFGVRMNAIAPVARTRMTLATPGGEAMSATADGDGFDVFSPANVSPLVAYLAMASCPVTGTVFHVGGNQIGLFKGWELARTVEADGRWDVADVEHAIPELLDGKLKMASVATDMASYNETFYRGFARLVS